MLKFAAQLSVQVTSQLLRAFSGALPGQKPGKAEQVWGTETVPMFFDININYRLIAYMM